MKAGCLHLRKLIIQASIKCAAWFVFCVVAWVHCIDQVWSVMCHQGKLPCLAQHSMLQKMFDVQSVYCFALANYAAVRCALWFAYFQRRLFLHASWHWRLLHTNLGHAKWLLSMASNLSVLLQQSIRWWQVNCKTRVVLFSWPCIGGRRSAKCSLSIAWQRS